PHTYPLSPISPPVSRRDEPFSDTSGYFPDHDDHGRNPVRAEPDSLRSPGTAFGQLWGMVAVGGADFYSHRIISYPVQQLRPVSVRSPAGMAVWSNRLFIFVPVLRLCWKPDDLLVYDLGRSNRSERRRVGIDLRPDGGLSVSDHAACHRAGGEQRTAHHDRDQRPHEHPRSADQLDRSFGRAVHRFSPHRSSPSAEGMSCEGFHRAGAGRTAGVGRFVNDASSWLF